MIWLLEPVNNLPFATVSGNGVKDGHGDFVAAREMSSSAASSGSSSSIGYLAPKYRVVFAGVEEKDIKLMEKSYQALIDSVAEGLLLQTRLKPYLDEVTLAMDETGIHLNWDGMFALFEQTWEQSHARGIADIIDFFRHPALAEFGEETTYQIQKMIVDHLMQLSEEEVRAIQVETRLILLGTQGTSGDDILVGTDKSNTMYGGAGNDILIGGSGTGYIYGESGNDMIYAGSGNCMVYGGDGNDTIYAGSKGSKLYGEAGDDTLISGQKSDYLSGGAGNDTYVFAKGGGQDTICDNYGTNTIRFTDVNADAVTFPRAGSYLVIGYGEDDRINVTNHFYSNNNYRIAKIEFANGKVYQLNDLLSPIPFAGDAVYQLSSFLPPEPVDDGSQMLVGVQLPEGYGL
jgi:hypothetical protein